MFKKDGELTLFDGVVVDNGRKDLVFVSTTVRPPANLYNSNYNIIIIIMEMI